MGMVQGRHAAVVVLALFVACGGETKTTDPATLVDCDDPLPSGACSTLGAACGGPCSDSWQARNVCKDGVWSLDGVVACGPKASEAPQCKDAFGGGQLGPCCGNELDCAGKPDGYPGFTCVSLSNAFCSCSCWSGTVLCAC